MTEPNTATKIRRSQIQLCLESTFRRHYGVQYVDEELCRKMAEELCDEQVAPQHCGLSSDQFDRWQRRQSARRLLQRLDAIDNEDAPPAGRGVLLWILAISFLVAGVSIGLFL